MTLGLVMDGLDIDVAHIVGLSMGGFATLHFGFDYPERALSLVVGGCGYGAEPDQREKFQKETLATIDKIKNDTMAVAGLAYASGPTRVQYENKDPRGWKEFETQLREHSTEGSANTMMGVQRLRPSLYELEEKMRSLTVPTMIINGDEDEPCLDPGLFMKRNISSSSLVVLPRSGTQSILRNRQCLTGSLTTFSIKLRLEIGGCVILDPRQAAFLAIPRKGTELCDYRDVRHS